MWFFHGETWRNPKFWSKVFLVFCVVFVPLVGNLTDEMSRMLGGLSFRRVLKTESPISEVRLRGLRKPLFGGV
jgi:hypothetical protein